MIRGKLPGNVEDTERRSKKFRLFKEVCFLWYNGLENVGFLSGSLSDFLRWDKMSSVSARGSFMARPRSCDPDDVRNSEGSEEQPWQRRKSSRFKGESRDSGWILIATWNDLNSESQLNEWNWVHHKPLSSLSYFTKIQLWLFPVVLFLIKIKYEFKKGHRVAKITHKTWTKSQKATTKGRCPACRSSQTHTQTGEQLKFSLHFSSLWATFWVAHYFFSFSHFLLYGILELSRNKMQGHVRMGLNGRIVARFGVQSLLNLFHVSMVLWCEILSSSTQKRSTKHFVHAASF